MPRYSIEHRTHYHYRRLVELGPQRLMVRPKDSHDLRLEDATLTLLPDAAVRWTHDVFGNSIATVTFSTPSDQLLIVSNLVVSRFSRGDAGIEIEDRIRQYPFVYAPDDRLNLAAFLNCHYAHCVPVVGEWAQSFIQPGMETLDLLRSINSAIRAGFSYIARDISGVQAPGDTLRYRSGTCRDFATLFIEAARSLGYGARFVTGYLYDPALDSGGNEGMVGAGATHAWAEVYLPGPGWVEFDPTNGLIESPSLLRVGVASDAEHAVPVSGSYMGVPDDVTGIDIEVTVKALSPDADIPVPVTLRAQAAPGEPTPRLVVNG